MTPRAPAVRPRKAIVPLAGRATRHRPASLTLPKGLFPLVDVDGRTKPVIQLILEEAFCSGVEEVCLVTGPGEDRPYRAYFEALARGGGPDWVRRPEAVAFATQETPEGFGHAVLCAREFAGGEPALVMLGDHVYLSDEARRCAAQVLDCYAAHGGASVSAVQRTPESELHLFGTVAAAPLEDAPEAARTYRVDAVVEKPSATVARAHLRAPGLPAGQYLCWFGLHAMSPAIFDVLAEDVAAGRRERGEFQFTAAQARLVAREAYLAYEVSGRRLDMGDPEGLRTTQATLGQAALAAARGRQTAGAEAPAPGGAATT